MPVVLITGATGFIGSQVALRTLEAGFPVRLVTRREDQIDKLRRIFSKYEDKLSFALVPEITAPGCYDEAFQGVDYVLHVASPLTGGGPDLLTPAVKGTLSVLESASKVPTIRKVVITASVASLIPLGPIPNGSVIREDNEIDFTVDAEKVPSLDPMVQYHASKLASYKATLDFVAENKPSFDVVTLHPVFVFGRSLVQETADQLGGTNGLLFQSLMSGKPTFGQYLAVHVDDVAVAHVKALSDDITGLQSYLLASRKRSWQDVFDFMKSRYPGLLIDFDTADPAGYAVDAGKAERELGIVFKEMEEQVADVVDQQLELKK